MRYKNILPLLLVMLVALAACNLGRGDTTEPIDGNDTAATLDPNASGSPTVSIISPQNNSEVVVRDDVLVSVNATDSVGVTRVQLFVNGQIVKTVSSESATGDRNMNALLDFKPQTAGDLTLRVVAYRGARASEPAEVTLKVKSTEAQVTAPPLPDNTVPVIDPNDPTCRVLVNTGLNFREGPGTNYNVIRLLNTGTVAPIMGRLGDNSWWQLRVGTTIGWVSAQFTTTYGNCAGIPIAAAPPTPTPRGGVPTNTPTATVTSSPTSQPTTTSTPGKADLVVVSITGPTTLTIPGGESSVSQTYTVTISNTGSGPSNQFSNTITVVGSPTMDLGVVANLDAGQTIALTVNLTFNAAGTYVVQVMADSASQVDEVSEVNNVGSIVVTVN